MITIKEWPNSYLLLIEVHSLLIIAFDGDGDGDGGGGGVEPIERYSSQFAISIAAVTATAVTSSCCVAFDMKLFYSYHLRWQITSTPHTHNWSLMIEGWESGVVRLLCSVIGGGGVDDGDDDGNDDDDKNTKN